MYRPGAAIAALSCLLIGCSTRTPEEPSGGRSSFLPPTAPSIVIENFLNAIAEKNTENFLLCLSDVSTRSRYPYVFEPSAEVGARFGSLFDRWSTQAERQAFLSLISRLPNERAPVLTLTSTNIAFSSPDSTVYVADYLLQAEHGITSIPTSLTGTLVLTITPETSGQWSISTWRDARRSTDSTEATWSLLKAQLSN